MGGSGIIGMSPGGGGGGGAFLAQPVATTIASTNARAKIAIRTSLYIWYHPFIEFDLYAFPHGAQRMCSRAQHIIAQCQVNTKALWERNANRCRQALLIAEFVPEDVGQREGATQQSPRLRNLLVGDAR